MARPCFVCGFPEPATVLNDDTKSWSSASCYQFVCTQIKPKECSKFIYPLDHLTFDDEMTVYQMDSISAV